MTTEDIKQYMAERLAEMAHLKGFTTFEVSAYSNGLATEFKAYNEHLGFFKGFTAESAIHDIKRAASSVDSLLKSAKSHREKAEELERQAAQLAAAETPELI